jgi:hypothetical protein
MTPFYSDPELFRNEGRLNLMAELVTLLKRTVVKCLT